MSGGGIFFSLANVYYASKQSYLFFIVIFILLCKLKLKKMLNVIYFYNLLYLARQGHHFAAVHRTTDPRLLHPSDIRETLWSCSLWFGTFWSHSFLIFKHILQAHSTKKGGSGSFYCSAVVVVVVPQFSGAQSGCYPFCSFITCYALFTCVISLSFFLPRSVGLICSGSVEFHSLGSNIFFSKTKRKASRQFDLFWLSLN